MIKNQEKAIIKVFLIPYDYREIKPYERTFLRQKSFTNSPDIIDESIQIKNNKKQSMPSLRYAIHLQFQCLPSKQIASDSTSNTSASSGGRRLYLFKSIRAVFSNRAPESGEKLRVVYETPDTPSYSSGVIASGKCETEEDLPLL